jgi:hypothetical protein
MAVDRSYHDPEPTAPTCMQDPVTVVRFKPKPAILCEYVFMRTTIDLPDPLFRELKAVAARRGTSLKNVIQAAVEEEIRKTERKAGRRLNFPVLPSEEPGRLDLTNAELDDLSA